MLGSSDNILNEEEKSNINCDAEVKQFKSLFFDPKTPKKCEYRLFLFDIKKYTKVEVENGFSIYEYNCTLNGEPFTMPPEYDSKKYICNYYKTIPTSFNQRYLVDQIKCYMKHSCFALAKFHGFTITDNENHFSPNFFTKRPKLGPLSTLITKNNFSPEQKYGLICGITYGIEFIHKLNFIHSNLNPTTVYVDEFIHPQICDYVHILPFEVTTQPKSDVGSPNQYVYSINSKSGENCFENCLYVAPEILKGKNFGSPVDIYSLGLVIFYIITGKEATFDEKCELQYPKKFNDEWKNLINGCINKDPAKRLTASQLLECLLDDSKMPLFISSISPNLNHSESSDLYIYLIKKTHEFYSEKNGVKFDIFHLMIPNVNEIDEDTKTIIKIAELYDSKCLEKVGDFLMHGQNGILKDEEFAFMCYQQASSDFNNIDAIIKCAKCYEEGIGIDFSAKKALRLYNIAHDHSQNDKQREEINEMIATLTKNTFIQNVPLSITSQEVKSFFNKFDLEIDEIQPEEGDEYKQMKLKFKNAESLRSAKLFLRKFQKKKENEESPFFNIEFEKMIKNNHFRSLSKILDKIELEDYCGDMNEKKEEYDQLGEGSYATTYLVYNKKTKKKYAAKILLCSNDDSDIHHIKREIIISFKFNHPSIIKYIGFSEISIIDKVSNQLTLIMDYAENGNLNDILKNNPKMWNNTAKLKVIIGIASGIAEIYRFNIVHRDLKPANIVTNGMLEPFICDFGFSRQFPKNGQDSMSNNVGTPYYNSPEIFNNEFKMFYTYEIDSYSFGIILYQILTNNDILSIYNVGVDQQLLVWKKFNNYVPGLPNDMNPVFKELIYDCWNVSMPERPNPLVIYTKLTEAIKRKIELLPDVDWNAIDSYLEKINEKH